jgi:hypothetical protein
MALSLRAAEGGEAISMLGLLRVPRALAMTEKRNL